MYDGNFEYIRLSSPWVFYKLHLTFFETHSPVSWAGSSSAQHVDGNVGKTWQTTTAQEWRSLLISFLLSCHLAVFTLCWFKGGNLVFQANTYQNTIYSEQLSNAGSEYLPE